MKLLGHVHTILGHLLPVPRLPEDFKTWMIPLSDGDQLHCRFYKGSDETLTVFFHGLGGCVDSNYMKVSGRVALEKGHSVLLVNHRGSGEGLKFAKGIYHSGVIDDVRDVMKYLRLKMPKAQITACGFSLSANLLLNFAGQSKIHLPDRIIVVNPPIDLHKVAERLMHPENFVYDQKFVRDLKRLIKEKVRIGTLDKAPVLPKFCRLIDIDDNVTAPLGGFTSRFDYYDKCSSINFAHNIKTPTHILMSEDDPFIPVESFYEAKFSPSVKLQITKRGGHVGYLSNPLGSSGVRFLGKFFSQTL